LNIPPAQIEKTKVEMTIVGGKIVMRLEEVTVRAGL
jgi:predicted amidohydrolase YtcJ